MVNNLVAGQSYRFKHKRKGAIVAKFISMVPTTGGDAEPYFINGDRAFVRVITAGGAGTLRWAPADR